MRLVFLILLLVNVAVFGYIRYAEQRGAAESQIALLQISPEKLKLLKRETLPHGDKSALVCLEWSSFAVDEAPRAAAALAKFELGERLAQRGGGAEGYWVILPLKTRAEAEKKASEVRALGVTDFYIVQDNDPWRNALALGAFKTEEAANTFLAQVRQRGVRSAVVGARGASNITFVIRDPGDAVAAKIAALKADFPNASLRATACPDPAQLTKGS